MYKIDKESEINFNKFAEEYERKLMYPSVENLSTSESFIQDQVSGGIGGSNTKNLIPGSGLKVQIESYISQGLNIFNNLEKGVKRLKIL